MKEEIARPSWPMLRILEAVIISAVAALGSSYVTVKILDERVTTIAAQVAALDNREARHHESIQEALRQIYTILVRGRPGIP